MPENTTFEFVGKHLREVIVIGGTTASGKSALALDLAQAADGVVINADSMQVYQGLSILSAAPSAEERQKAPHRLYEIYPPHINGTVVDWLERAVAEIRTAWDSGKLPIVTGGTGLYIDNLVNGTTPIPEPDPALRHKILQLAKSEGAAGLYARLKVADEEAAKMVSPKDVTRLRRALEIKLQTGRSIADWYRQPLLKKLPEAHFRIIKIIPETEELDKRCYQRFDKMMDAGAAEEVRKLAALHLDRSLPAMKMLGVPELLGFIEGRSSLEEAVELAKLHTRQYAKRQRTWFKNKLAADMVLNEIYMSNKRILDKILLTQIC